MIYTIIFLLLVILALILFCMELMDERDAYLKELTAMAGDIQEYL